MATMDAFKIGIARGFRNVWEYKSTTIAEGPHRSPLEGAQFSCASWKKVRIFEEIFGLFQDAHFSKMVRIFE
jgi:hypothetical protein